MVGIDFKMIFFSIHQLMNYKKWQSIRIYPALKSLIINQTMTHLQRVFEIKVYGVFGVNGPLIGTQIYGLQQIRPAGVWCF